MITFSGSNGISKQADESCSDQQLRAGRNNLKAPL